MKALAAIALIGAIGLGHASNAGVAARSQAQAQAVSDPIAREIQRVASDDRMLAAIGYRLATRSAELCPPGWAAGFELQALAQYGRDYRAAAGALLGITDRPTIALVVSGSAADAAGLRPGDILLSADGRPFAAIAGDSLNGEFAAVDAAITQLEAALRDGAARLVIERGGAQRTIRLDATSACASRFQVGGTGLNAGADGTWVQVSPEVMAYAQGEGQVAAIVAHELAHNLLRHRERLDRAGLRRGFAANFGRNAALIRASEMEADRLSIWLLDRAGYDTADAIAFWRRYGNRGLHRVFSSATHPSARVRMEQMEAERRAIDALRAGGSTIVPPAEIHPLFARERPLERGPA